MNNRLVYDWPLRVFHWVFAGLFVTAFLIAKRVDEESVTFSYHMLAGMILGLVVILRLVWGFVGARYSRFSSFALRPADLGAYFRGIFSGDQRKWSGHNPASSWGTLVMLALALGLGFTGYLMVSGYGETFEDVHELLANGFLIVVLIHIAGIALHTLRHRDPIGLSMIKGTKRDVAPGEAITNPRPIMAILFLALVTAFAFYLLRNFDRPTRKLHVVGVQLQLGDPADQKSHRSE